MEEILAVIKGDIRVAVGTVLRVVSASVCVLHRHDNVPGMDHGPHRTSRSLMVTAADKETVSESRKMLKCMSTVTPKLEIIKSAARNLLVLRHVEYGMLTVDEGGGYFVNRLYSIETV